MKITPLTKIKRNKDLITKRLANNLVIFSPISGNIYTLNETAAFLWSHIKTPISAENLAEVLVEVYDVDKKRAKRDVEEFLTRYLRHNLIKIVK